MRNAKGVVKSLPPHLDGLRAARGVHCDRLVDLNHCVCSCVCVSELAYNCVWVTEPRTMDTHTHTLSHPKTHPRPTADVQFPIGRIVARHPSSCRLLYIYVYRAATQCGQFDLRTRICRIGFGYILVNWNASALGMAFYMWMRWWSGASNNNAYTSMYKVEEMRCCCALCLL